MKDKKRELKNYTKLQKKFRSEAKYDKKEEKYVIVAENQTLQADTPRDLFDLYVGSMSGVPS